MFGSAIGSRMTEIGGVPYGAFIVPGLMMLSILTESIGNASFGIYFPKWSGTIYELLSAPVSTTEVLLGYVGAAATKSLIIGVHHPRHRRVLRAAAHRSPVADAAVPGARHLDVLPVRLRARHLGR